MGLKCVERDVPSHQGTLRVFNFRVLIPHYSTPNYRPGHLRAIQHHRHAPPSPRHTATPEHQRASHRSSVYSINPYRTRFHPVPTTEPQPSNQLAPKGNGTTQPYRLPNRVAPQPPGNSHTDDTVVSAIDNTTPTANSLVLPWTLSQNPPTAITATASTTAVIPTTSDSSQITNNSSPILHSPSHIPPGSTTNAGVNNTTSRIRAQDFFVATRPSTTISDGRTLTPCSLFPIANH